MIRHFATIGNLHKRYIGITDESLCEEGKLLLKNMNYPFVDAIYSSPLIRCIETAGLIYPNLSPVIYKDLRECDFGTFENKNYMELSDNPDYQTWIDSKGLLSFPSGESLVDFKLRCISAFDKLIEESIHKKYRTIAMVVHGGTIMSILDEYSYPHHDYYDWQIDNGSGYIMEYDKGRLIHICGFQSYQ